MPCCRQACRAGQETLEEPGPGGADRQLALRDVEIASGPAGRVVQVRMHAKVSSAWHARLHGVHGPVPGSTGALSSSSRQRMLNACAGAPVPCLCMCNHASARSRKTLIYLILTLNHIYPDYDFSQLRAHHFLKEDGLGTTEEVVDSHLLEVSKVCVCVHSLSITTVPYLSTMRMPQSGVVKYSRPG